MAKQSTARTSPGNSRAIVTARQASHKILEGMLLLSALGILCVLFSFFALELQNISRHALTFDAQNSAVADSAPLTPPRVEARVLGSELILTEVDETGTPTHTIYTSNLTDAIADFTLFSVPQIGYQGVVYVRPLLDGDLPLLKVYPLDVATGTLRSATLNVAADASVLSSDGTLVGVYADGAIGLYALEDGATLAASSVPSEWQKRMDAGKSSLELTENSCLTLSLPLDEPEAIAFSPLCP